MTFTDSRAYAEAVTTRIRQKLVIPQGVPDTANATFEVRVAKNGALATVRMAQSSGFRDYDENIEHAIYLAEPLPVLLEADRSEPRPLQLNFRVR